MKTTPLIVVACALAIPLLVLAGQAAWSRRNPPARPGQAGDGLLPCGRSLNCVASSGGSGPRTLAPLRYAGSEEEARRRLHGVLQEFPHTRVVLDAGSYMRVEFQSRWFGFVDDVEFLFAQRDGQIDFRSASRVGYFDLGANRRRMEEVRLRFDRGRSSAAAETTR